MLYIIANIKFLIDNIIYYLIFYEEDIQNKSKRKIFKKGLPFFLISTCTLTISYYLLVNKVLATLISTAVFIIYFSIDPRSKRKYRLIFTYSFFVNFLIECIHFISYKLFYIITYYLGIFNSVSQPIAWSYILVIYSVMSIAIFKFGLIKIEQIRQLSKYTISTVISFVLLIAIVLFKYFYKHLSSIENCLAASTAVLFLIILLLFIWSMINKRIEIQNKTQNNLIQNKVFKNIEQICTEIGVSIEEYEIQSQLFISKLNKLGINSGFEGFVPMVLSLVIMKNYNGKCIKLRRDVYPIISKNIGVNIETIDKNIKTCICKAWDKFDEELFIKEYGKAIDKYKGEPSVKEFLLNICNNVKINKS